MNLLKRQVRRRVKISLLKENLKISNQTIQTREIQLEKNNTSKSPKKNSRKTTHRSKIKLNRRPNKSRNSIKPQESSL